MTLEPLTKAEMEYVQQHDKNANVVVTNRQHTKKKTRFLEITPTSYKYLMEFRKNQESKVIEKHGWFDEPNEKGKVHKVFYK